MTSTATTTTAAHNNNNNTGFPNETPGSTQEFKHEAVYKGKVVSQNMKIVEATGLVRLIIGVKVEGQLFNKWNSDSGLLKAPDVTVEAIVNFPPDDEEKMLWSMQSLANAFGWQGAELEELNPANPSHFSLVGKAAYVGCKMGYKDGEQVPYFNLRAPRSGSDKSNSPRPGEVRKTAAAELFARLRKGSDIPF